MYIILKSPYQLNEVQDILRKQMDEFPSLLKSLVTLNSHFFFGTSTVCGTISGLRFELRNRSGPRFSLRAEGKLFEGDEGTTIEMFFKRPLIPDLSGLLFNRYKYDREKIMAFLKEWLKIEDWAELSP